MIRVYLDVFLCNFVETSYVMVRDRLIVNSPRVDLLMIHWKGRQMTRISERPELKLKIPRELACSFLNQQAMSNDMTVEATQRTLHQDY